MTAVERLSSAIYRRLKKKDKGVDLSKDYRYAFSTEYGKRVLDDLARELGITDKRERGERCCDTTHRETKARVFLRILEKIERGYLED